MFLHLQLNYACDFDFPQVCHINTTQVIGEIQASIVKQLKQIKEHLISVCLIWYHSEQLEFLNSIPWNLSWNGKQDAGSTYTLVAQIFQ